MVLLKSFEYFNYFFFILVVFLVLKIMNIPMIILPFVINFKSYRP